MALTTVQMEEIIENLYSAEKECREVIKVTDKYADMTIEEAYIIQDKLMKRNQNEGRRKIGVKLGLTSKPKQQMMGVHEAIYGVLMDNMLCLEWEPVPFSELIHPKAEPEIAFFIGEDINGPNVTGADVLKATKYIAPAIEIIDSRYKDFKFTLNDVVADNTSSAKFLVGSKLTSPIGLDLANLGAIMTKNGELVQTGAGAAILGHPAVSVAWAVNKLAEQGKEGFKKGEIVLSGAITEAVSFVPGDSILVEFAELGSVSFTCK